MHPTDTPHRWNCPIICCLGLKCSVELTQSVCTASVENWYDQRMVTIARQSRVFFALCMLEVNIAVFICTFVILFIHVRLEQTVDMKVA